MSVKMTYLSASSSVTNPIATPTTGAEIGTPATIRARVEPHTDPIELEPLQESVSETTRIAYGNLSLGGRTGTKARSAKNPCPISRRPTPRFPLASPTEYPGKL